MGSLDVIQPPALNFLSLMNDKSNATDKIRRFSKKAYSRIRQRHQAKLRRMSASRSPERQRLQKWQLVNSRNRRALSYGDRDNERAVYHMPSTETPSQTSPRSALSPFSSLTSLTSSENLPRTPRTRNTSLDESDSLTPSPIRNSPLYGRPNKRRGVSLPINPQASDATGRALSYPDLAQRSRFESDRRIYSSHLPNGVVSYPELPTSPSVEIIARFEPYHSDNKLSDSTIDSRLMDKLLTGPKPGQGNEKPGLVYTFQIEEDNRFVKIGQTCDSIESRLTALSPGKKFGRIRNMPDPTPGAERRLVNSLHIEKTIHLELHNCRHLMKNSRQTEWFEISLQDVFPLVNKWRKWAIECEPYDQNGKLTDFWKFRIEQKRTRDPYDPAKHQNLHHRWNVILNPNWWDKTVHKLCVVWAILLMFWRWPQEHKMLFSVLVVIFSYLLLGFIYSLLPIMLIGVHAFPKKETKIRKKTSKGR